MKKFLLSTIVFSTLISCATSSAGKISYIPKTADEINTTNSLRTFLSKNKNPKVVLRVNNSKYNLTQNENLEPLYSTIEKELMSNGFDVRDRLLFNQITENKDNTTDYQNLYSKTDTDLIIELMEMNAVPYVTNIYKDEKTGEEKTGTFDMTKYGSSVEFKVIIIKTNQFAGSYRFHTTPCIEGCVYQAPILSFKDMKALNKLRKNQEPTNPEPKREYFDKKANEDFIRVATQKLISAMRNN